MASKNKRKPHKGLLKRIRISAKGKILRHKANKGHLMTCKSGNRRRRLGRTAKIAAVNTQTIRRMLALQ